MNSLNILATDLSQRWLYYCEEHNFYVLEKSLKYRTGYKLLTKIMTQKLIFLNGGMINKVSGNGNH